MDQPDKTEELFVLCVDDHQAILDGLELMIQDKHPGWKVLFTSSPIDAVKLYRKYRHTLDVVVCDIRMPGISGIDIMYAIQSQSPRIGVISLSGQLDRDALVGVRKYADAHLCKPFNVETLCRTILEVHAAKKAAAGSPRD